MIQVPIEAMGGSDRVKEDPKGSATRKGKPAFGMVHRALRAATLSDHASIDRMLLQFDLNRPDDYTVFLNIHFAALVTLQADWRAQDVEDFARMLRCLQADLASLGCPTTTLPAVPPTPMNRSNAGWGVAYVVRGSRLGAAVLRRGVVSDLPTSYLDFVPVLPWGEFLLGLESIAGDSSGVDEATRAARRAFKAFVTEFERLKGVVTTRPPK
jgi:heme oxygenase